MRGCDVKTALIATTLILSGCAVPLSAEVAEQHNTCSSDSDCPDGACVEASGGKICAATTVTLSELKLVVTPAAGSTSVTTAPTVLDPAQHVPVAKNDGTAFNTQFDATLPALVQVKFATVYPCGGKEATSLPSQMALTSVASVPGLPVSTFFTTPDPTAPLFQVAAIPAGLYSAYVVPDAAGECATAPPPSIFEVCLQDACPPHSIRPSKVTTLNLSGDQLLSGSITSRFSLDKWTLDLIDLDGARVLSDELVLKPQGGVLATQVSFDSLHFNLPDKKKPPTIRLTPPAGSSAPVMYWDLASALGPSTTYDVKLTLGDFANQSQTTQVLVLDDKGKAPQPGALVTFQSLEIDNLDCAASVTRSLHADALGQATVDLPPGRYTVRATPLKNNSPLSIGETTVEVTKIYDAPLSGGHTVVLPKKADLVGSISTLGGEALANVSVDVVPSQSVQSYDLVSLTTNNSFPARPFTTTTDDSGRFSLKVDIGAPLDVSVRPADGSGYPWLVQPQFLLQKSGEVDTTLKGSKLAWPALLRGTLRDPDGSPVANAKVDAYLPLDQAVVVQIGETTTDSEGNYELVLPASISSGK